MVETEMAATKEAHPDAAAAAAAAAEAQEAQFDLQAGGAAAAAAASDQAHGVTTLEQSSTSCTYSVVRPHAVKG
jgi:hypothetical protein